MKLLENKWTYLLFLALVWGSSFILIKKSLVGLTPIQLGALRIVFAGVFLLLVGFKSVRKIQKRQWKWVLISALCGTFIPAFLFAYAIRGIDSSITAILNSVTPFNTLWIGVILFSVTFKSKQLLGIVVGLIGTILLVYQGAEINPNQNYWYALLPIVGSLGYATNINVIKKHLQDVDPKSITVGGFVLIIIPALLILVLTGFFTSMQTSDATSTSAFYILVLAIFGTGIAKIVFNKLIHVSSVVFASSVTYLIPIVAVLWGTLDGERLSYLQVLSTGLILLGVWLVNKSKK